MPRQSRSYKNQLDKLDEEKRRDARVRQKLYPLRIAQIASIPRARKEKIGERLLELSDIYDSWRTACIHHWNNYKIDQRYEKWSELAEDPYSWGYHAIHNMVKLSEQHDIKSIHKTKEVWFGPDNYALDCSVMLSKLINNVWWAKELNEPNMVSANLWQFPTMDPVLGEGPVRPHADAVFDQFDEHVVVSEGPHLFFVPYHNRQIEDVYYMELEYE